MASSDEKPASAATQSADDSKRADGGGKEAQATEKPRQKTLIGLGKLRESLKKSSTGKSSGKAGTSLRIPKPASRRKTTPGLTLPKPKEAPPAEESTSEELAGDQGPTTDRVEEIPEDTFDEFDEEPSTDQLEGSLVEDTAVEADDEPMTGESTMLTESPFEGEATMVTDSPLESSDAPEEEFEVEATMVTDSPLVESDAVESDAVESDAVAPDADDEFDGVAKTTVSLHGDLPAASGPLDRASAKQTPAKTPLTHTTNPNPPTPEQKPRVGSFSKTAKASSANMQVEAILEEDSDAAADDFHAEKTEVFDSPYENEALVARLVVLSGPAAGQEYLLNKQRNTIGRGKNNTIIVSDLAMSRQHLEVLEQPDQTYLLVDLQAANGTRLNSTRVKEAELMHGDRIEAGKTEFQFVIPGDRPQPRNRNRHLIPKRDVSTPQNRTQVRQMHGEAAGDETTDKILTYVIIGAGVLSVLLISAAGYLFLNKSSEQPQPQAEAVATEDPRAQALYLEGVEKVKDRDWVAARASFEQVGSIDAKFPGVAAQLERVSREQRSQKALERAEALFINDDIEEAAEAAGAISNRSVYFEEAQNLVRKARQRRITLLYEKAQEEVTAENLEQASVHLAAILEEVPNHKGALELQETLTKGKEDEEDQAEDESDEDAQRASSRDESRRRASAKKDDWLSSSGSSSSRSSSGSSTRVNFTKGFTLYKSGKFERAAAHFKGAASRSSGAVASRASKTARHIVSFADTYKRASRAFDAGAWRTAIEGLEDASRADRAVARSGYFRGAINSKLATAHGKIGLSEFKKDNFAAANRHYAKGYKYERSNSTVNALRRELSNKARGLYILAANKRKTDPGAAKELCRQIISMVPSSHSMHQKAKKMLAEL